jgi:group I intron endonuclease
MKSGIYKITIGRWFYYGQTNNFTKRKNRHYNSLKKGTHHNILLQRAWDKHQTFCFEECAYEQDLVLLTELEQLVIDEWFGKEGCANLNPEANRPPDATGKKLKPRRKEHSDKISAAKKGSIPWNKGIPMSEEAKVKSSATQKGRNNPHSEEHKARRLAAIQNYWNTKRNITNG